MNIIRYNRNPDVNPSRNLDEEKPRVTTERQRNIDIGSMMTEATQPSSKISTCLKKYWYLILIASILIVAGLIIGLVLGLRNKDDETPVESKTPTNSFPTEKELEEAKQVFSPSFKVSSTEKTLTQLSQTSFQTYESTNQEQESSYTILNKAVYDIYTINSTDSSNSENIFYTKKYTTVITVNSLCSKVSTNPEEDDCQLERQLNLNTREESNLRRNEEDAEDLIKKVILPICLIEHTDTNLIISLTCPETLGQSYKSDIMRAFNNIRPESIKGFEFDKNYVNTIVEEKEDKIYINSFDNVCQEPNEAPDKTIICNMTKNIITDNEGNLISSKTSNSTKSITDENNSFSNNFTYIFKNVPKENSESFNEEIFKKNLESLLSLTSSFMKKEIYINNFTELALDLFKEEPEVNTNLRGLREEDATRPGVHEEVIFPKTIYNITMDLNLKNDIGLTEDKTTKASCVYDVNKENFTELSNNRIKTDLYETLNKFISLSKSGNKIANKLYQDLNEPLLNFMDIINENIKKINDILANKDLSEIFDSTYAISELKVLPFNFVDATEKLYSDIKDLEDKLLYEIYNPRKKLEDIVSSFLSISHNLMFKIFNNLTELSDALSTENSKIVGISSYYLNNTEDSYYEIIENATKILDNYYINEKNNFSKLFDPIIQRFYENTINITQNCQSSLDDISDRLNDGSITITHGDPEHYQKAISNIYNSKIKINEIIETVKNKFQGALKLKSNGYFETQEELDQNSQSYGQIGKKALTISYALDNNEFIDKTFDNVMTSFRNKYMNLLKYMENSIKDKFPLEENVLGTSLFDSGFINEIDEYFDEEKKNVLNFITNENKGYLENVNNHINNFASDNGKSLEQIISDLLNEMTDIYLDNLNSAFNDSLGIAFKTIDKIIENNKKLGNEYLLEVKNSGSFHKTTGFINKYNTFVDSIQDIYNFVKNNLRINLSNKYKNVITQIRSLLQSIKSNKILEKYYKQLPSAEKHLNSINSLFETFNRHISDNYYNEHFLHLIGNYIKNTTEKLNKIINDFKDIYNEIDKKDLNDILNDYDNQRVVKGTRYRCSRIRFWKYCYHPDQIYYDGKDVNSTNNHLKLSKVNFGEYILNFDNKYKELYSPFSNNVKTYNSLLTSLDKKIEDEAKKDSLNGKNNYLENISTKVKSIISQKLGKNLLDASYNYFKNKIANTLPTELNNIIEQWKNAYDSVNNDINSNKDNFKSSVYEFFYLASFHVQLYSQEIAYGYGNSIVEKIKNEFNYTNKFYYNLIISKLNHTFTYILSNLPYNEKPFDTILNKRTNEIKTIYNNLIGELKKSKNEILDKTKQEASLQVNSNNFFKSNDMISEHITAFNTALGEKIAKIALVAGQIQKEEQNELVAAKFYLENSINGKQIKDNYEMVNKATFVDLQTNEYEKLIDDIWQIDRADLINNIIYILKKFNETNNNNFKYEKEKYIELLQNKLYEEFGNKDLLIQRINSNFSNGINNCKENSKVKIEEILDSILQKIINHLTNEASRLSNQLTSYSNDFTVIKNRLNNYKASIYEQFYSTITYVVNDFHEQLLDKFYKNYIESGLNEFERYIDETNFGTANFINMTIDLNSIIQKEFKLIITDYKNLTYNQIQYMYQKYIQSLDKLFSFSQMKLKINNAIDNVYNSKLLPILKQVGIYNPGNEGVSNYDLPDSILNDTDCFIKEKISNIKKIIKEMEGKKYIINDLVPADFSKGGGNIYDKIKTMFTNFTKTYKSKEEKDFNETVAEYAISNFKNLMDNFIPSFGVDFFERILKFNEIQKINILYRHLKHSLSQTIVYYVAIADLHKSIHLPIDIKLKLFNLNDLDSIVKIKNDLIISTINGELERYFEETKNYVVTKYINDMLKTEKFEMEFNTNTKKMIEGIISGNIQKYENKYLNMMKEYIKDYFIEEYKATLNEATKDMKDYVEKAKVDLKVNLDNIFSLDSDSVLANIQNKLNKTKIAIENYNDYYATIKIPEETISFLDNFGNNYIANKYKYVKDLLNEHTTELVMKNLEKLSNEYRQEYSIEFFQEEINKINKNVTSYYNEFNKILDNYGSIEDIYEKNLDAEIANYRRIRLLEETNIGQKMTDIKLNNTFNELKKTSELVKNFIQSLTLFTNFEENLDKFINEKNKQYSYTVYNLDQNKNKNNFYDLMVERLEELNQLSSEYYPQVKMFYEIAKEQIIDGIIEINNLINSCEKITIETIKNKYLEIKNQFNKVEDSQNLIKSEIDIIPYKTNRTDNYFTVETVVENYLIDNRFTLDIIFDEETTTPKIIGKLINNVKPKKFDIDFYSTFGQNNKLGREIKVIFNNISSYSNIIFDSSLNQANIITNFDFDEYTVKTQYYEEKSEVKTIIILGVTYVFEGGKIRYYIDTADEEKVKSVDAKNVTFTENYVY